MRFLAFLIMQPKTVESFTVKFVAYIIMSHMIARDAFLGTLDQNCVQLK